MTSGERISTICHHVKAHTEYSIKYSNFLFKNSCFIFFFHFHSVHLRPVLCADVFLPLSTEQAVISKIVDLMCIENIQILQYINSPDFLAVCYIYILKTTYVYQWHNCVVFKISIWPNSLRFVSYLPLLSRSCVMACVA